MNELDFVDTAANLAFFLDLLDKKQATELPDALRHLSREAQVAHLIEIAPGSGSPNSTWTRRRSARGPTWPTH